MKKINLLTLLFVCFTVLAYAQNVIEGTVKNGQGQGISRASVSVPALGFGTITDENGNFSISGIPNGKYAVEASGSGYESDVASVSVAGNQRGTINFVLSRVNKNIKEIVVTGVAGARTSLESSISISSLKANTINNSAPRTTAEIFRSIPGIRSESSGGDGNSNITVRGVPVSAGGSRYLLIQEDGLPVLQFGDVAFGTQDQFVRFDNTINRVEALRGGSASILASNSPAGIINFISKTGEVEGGSVASTFGLDWNNFRTDFEYGAPISKDLFFHVGGFYRVGDGPRKTGYTSNNGGQMKASVTKKFNNGYVRIYGKMLNDRAAAYMPMPINVAGTNANPTWSSLSDYDAINGTLHSIFLTKDRTIGGNNNLLNSDVTDGMRSLTNALGTELSFNLGEGWKITNRARFAGNSGQFLAPFPASAGTYNDIFGGITNIKEAVYAGSWTPVPTTGTYMRVHLFNTKLNNFNNYMNDLTISKRLNDNIKLNLGMYKSLQNINMDWHWNTYFMKANTGTMNLVDVIATDSSRLTSNGLYAYGVPAWGNCCNRTIDTKYDITAPYANLEIKATDNLNIDGGIRYDLGHAFGSYNGGNGKTSTIDVNGDGTIQPNEVSVAGFDNNITAVNYGYNILGYSLGANYQLNDQSSLFGRVSRGGTAAADRVLFEGYNYVGNTDNTLNARKVNYVAQQELGYKYRTPKTALNATLFRATTKESNYEATTQKKTSNDYQSIGLELDGNVNLSQAFGIRGGLTAMSSKITNAIDTSIIGNTPRRTPAVMLNLMPTFGFNENKGMVGLNLLGVSKSFAQDNNKLVMPGYLVINPFFNYQVAKGLVLGLNGNNITNALGITESEEGSITENQNNFVRARPIPGRTISGSIRYNF